MDQGLQQGTAVPNQEGVATLSPHDELRARLGAPSTTLLGEAQAAPTNGAATAAEAFRVLKSSLETSDGTVEGSPITWQVARTVVQKAEEIFYAANGGLTFGAALSQAVGETERVFTSERESAWAVVCQDVERCMGTIPTIMRDVETTCTLIDTFLENAVKAPGAIKEGSAKSFGEASNRFSQAAGRLAGVTTFPELSKALIEVVSAVEALATSLGLCQRDINEELKKVARTEDSEGRRMWFLSKGETQSPRVLVAPGAPLPRLTESLASLVSTLEQFESERRDLDAAVSRARKDLEVDPANIIHTVRTSLTQEIVRSLPAELHDALERDKASQWPLDARVHEYREIARIRREFNHALSEHLRKIGLPESSREFLIEPIKETPQLVEGSPYALVTFFDYSEVRFGLITRFGLVEIARVNWGHRALIDPFLHLRKWAEETLGATPSNISGVQAPIGGRVGGHIARLGGEEHGEVVVADSFQRVSDPLIGSFWTEAGQIAERQEQTTSIAQSAGNAPVEAPEKVEANRA